MTKQTRRSGAKLRTAIGAGVAALLLAAALPGAGFAHWVYTKQAAPDTEEWFPEGQLAGASGFVIAWSLNAVGRAGGTVYGEKGTGYELAVRTQCVGLPPTQYDDAVGTKTSQDGILQAVARAACPEGVDIEWTQGRYFH